MTAGRHVVSVTKDWCTPPKIVESVKECFNGTIHLDPCSNDFSFVDAQVEYRLPESDGLRASWDYPTIYVNPPYGSDKQRGTRILHWFERIGEAASRGSEVIALVPVATNTSHWKRFVYPKAAAICFLYQPRVRFFIRGVEDSKGAPMSCAVIYWGDRQETFTQAFAQHGAVVSLAGVRLPPGQGTLL